MAKLVGMQEAMQILGVSRPTFERWQRHGRIPACRDGHKRLFKPEDLQRVRNIGIERAAEITGISKARLLQMSACKEIPCEKSWLNTYSRWMYNEAELRTWIAEQRGVHEPL